MTYNEHCSWCFPSSGESRITVAREDIIKWVEDKRPANTVKLYGTYGEQYRNFARQEELPESAEETLAAFMIDAVDRRKLSRSTVTQAIPAAVNHLFRYSPVSAPSPTKSVLVREVKKAAERVTKPSRSKLPLTIEHLRLMARAVTLDRQSIRNFTLIIISFFGMMRESEVVAITAEDIKLTQIENRQCLAITVRKAKNDQLYKGHTRILSAGPSPLICPVWWFTMWWLVRAPSAQHIFHNLSQSSLGQPLSTATPTHILRSFLAAIGVPATERNLYASHSCRRGGVTAAAAAGVDVRLIARHGNWRSDAILLYVDETAENQMSVTARMHGIRFYHIQ